MNEKSRRPYLWLPVLLALALFTFGASGCATTDEGEDEGDGEGATAVESLDEAVTETGEEIAAVDDEVWPPEHVVIQHVLIGFEGSVDGKNITRSQDEAEALAADILKRAQDGEDFGPLVQEFTDDSYPGFYFLANEGIEPASSQEVPRGKMVKGFGDVAFELKMGDVGVAKYDAQASPFGWHIIKRVEAQ